MRDDFAGGASAARNKIASYLTDHGVPVLRTSPHGPPTDDDFLRAVLAGPIGGIRADRSATRWCGPVYLDLDFVSAHDRTLRYDAGPEGGSFKAYLPKPLLPRRRQTTVCLGLAATEALLPPVVKQSSDVRTGLTVGQYVFVEVMTKVLLFKGGVQGSRREELYVPRVIFKNKPYTDDLFLRVYT